MVLCTRDEIPWGRETTTESKQTHTMIPYCGQRQEGNKQGAKKG